MIPVEIVVAVVILWLIYKGVLATVRAYAARKELAVANAKIAELNAENAELRETVIRLNDGQPIRGPGWTTGKGT